MSCAREEVYAPNSEAQLITRVHGITLKSRLISEQLYMLITHKVDATGVMRIFERHTFTKSSKHNVSFFSFFSYISGSVTLFCTASSLSCWSLKNSNYVFIKA